MSALQQVAMGAGVANHVKTNAYVNAVVAAGGTVSFARRAILNTLFTGLDTDSLTSIIDRLWLLAAENSQSALIDLINLQSATAVNSPTFTANQGYTGNGTSSYVDTNIKPSQGVNFTQNSGSFGVYIRNARTAGAAKSAMSSDRDAAWCAFFPKYVDDNLYGNVNNSTDWATTTGPANVSGIWLVSRTSSSACTVYRAGSSFVANGSTASVARSSTQNIVVLASQNSSGTVSEFSDDQIGMAYIAAGFDGTQASNFNSRIQTYLTAVGA